MIIFEFENRMHLFSLSLQKKEIATENLKKYIQICIQLFYICFYKTSNKKKIIKMFLLDYFSLEIV